MMSKTFVIGWSKTGLVWTTHSLMSAKILYGNAVSLGPVRNFRLYWIEIYVEDELNTEGHLQSIWTFSTWSRLMAVLMLLRDCTFHCSLLPLSSSPLRHLVLHSRFQTPTLVLPTYSDVTICTCTPAFFPATVSVTPIMSTDVPSPLTLLSQPASCHDWMKQWHHLPLSPLFSFSDSLSEIKRIMSGCS